MSSLCSRLRTSQSFLEGVARAIGETGDGLRKSWSERVTPLNTLASKRQLFVQGVMFPASMDEEVSDE